MTKACGMFSILHGMHRCNNQVLAILSTLNQLPSAEVKIQTTESHLPNSSLPESTDKQCVTLNMLLDDKNTHGGSALSDSQDLFPSSHLPPLLDPPLQSTTMFPINSSTDVACQPTVTVLDT